MEIVGCACGQNHETMPMIDISTCCCVWAGEDPDCDHSSVWVEGVCREHKRHEPCRPCMSRDIKE